MKDIMVKVGGALVSVEGGAFILKQSTYGPEFRFPLDSELKTALVSFVLILLENEEHE